MNSKNLMVIFGTLLSIVLLIIVFSRLDWSAFLATLKTVNLSGILLAGIMIMVNIALRSLRWTLVARMPLANLKHFWQAVNIGYLGNMIYPARAGEVLKVVAIHHFTPLVWGRAISTAIIDRMLDMIVVGIFTLLVLWIHAHRIDPMIGKGVMGVFGITVIGLILLIILADRLHAYIQRWTVQGKWSKRLQDGLLHAFEGIQAFRHTRNLVIVLFLTISMFLVDYFWMWWMTDAFGWDLPFDAGLTIGVFLLLSISIPSAPGYVGIYQVACIFALGLYGIDETLAVAYSIVLQLLTFAVMGIQGLLVTLYCGFNISQERDPALSQIQEINNTEVTGK